jgi:methylase of polypeptide subunit release factors
MIEFAIPGQTHFKVYHDSQDDGGGTWFGQEYVSQVSQRYGKVNRCLEWCSGPGFIGWALLAHDLCDHITFQDCHAAVSQGISITADRNNSTDRAAFWCGNTVSCIPPQQFDLVVANPPHYLECPGDENYQRLAVDTDWSAHQSFFAQISSYLAPNGRILLQENQAGSLKGVADFWHMIFSNRLRVSAYWTSPDFYDTAGPTQIYYIEIQHQK